MPGCLPSAEFFSKFATVNAVRLRRHLTSKDFKGSVFVEFATKEEADKVGWPGWNSLCVSRLQFHSYY